MTPISCLFFFLSTETAEHQQLLLLDVVNEPSDKEFCGVDVLPFRRRTNPKYLRRFEHNVSHTRTTTKKKPQKFQKRRERERDNTNHRRPFGSAYGNRLNFREKKTQKRFSPSERENSKRVPGQSKRGPTAV